MRIVAADIMLRSIIVIVVAREPSIVLFWRETRLKYVIFPQIFHELSVPESNATFERASKHGRLDLTEQTDQKRKNWMDF